MIAALRRRRQRNMEDDFVMLGALSKTAGPAFAYPLSEAVGLRPYRVYASLDRLMQAGLVEDGWEDNPVRPRRWYRLTADGRHEMTVRRIP